MISGSTRLHHCPLARLVLGLDLLGDAQREPADERGQRDRDPASLGEGQAEVGEGIERTLGVAHRLGHQRRPRDTRERGEPAVPTVEPPLQAVDAEQPFAGRLRRGRGQRRGDEDRPQHEPLEVLAAGHVAVQRHRGHAELAREPAHRHRVQALAIGDRDRPLDDLRASVAARGPRGRGPGRERTHGRARTGTRDDQPLVAQHRDRPARRRHRDTVRVDQLARRRQPVARAQPPVGDVVAQDRCDACCPATPPVLPVLLHASAVLERPRRDARQ